MLTLTSLARADRHMLLNARNDVQRWTVLTAICQVNGRWQISTPYRIETPKPLATKFGIINYIRERTPKPNLVQIHPLWASEQMGEI